MENETNVNQNNSFQERLKALRGEKRLQDVATDLGISRASLGYYESGERKPDIDILFKIADYYKVSADYLLGISNTKTRDCNVQMISKTTGLNEIAIDRLAGYQQNASRIPKDEYDTTPMYGSLVIDTLNRLLHPSCDVLENIANYIYLNLDYYYDDDNYRDERLYKHISGLSFFDKRLGVSFGDDYDYISQIFLIMIQNELSWLREKTRPKPPKRITPIATDSEYLQEDE